MTTSNNGSSDHSNELRRKDSSSSSDQRHHPAFQKKPIPRPLMDENNVSSSSAGRKKKSNSSRLYDAVASSDNDHSFITDDNNNGKSSEQHAQMQQQQQQQQSVPGQHDGTVGETPGEQQEETDPSITITRIERHLSLIDLMAIGIGGTIGSGLFVLVGLVAHKYAGPATTVSWCISGLAACLSGCAYAELSARIPAAGGAYAYSYVAIGEFPAILTATCLSMNYIASSAAVARSWGDKVEEWFVNEIGEEHWLHVIFKPYKSFSPFAFLISSGAILLLLNGVKESKRATNFFTSLKALTALFMVIMGFYFASPTNWSPFLPAQFGVSGVMRGATGTFFGYLGYDSVACLGGEAINPKQNLPIAILMTLGGVSVLYVLATLALTGMQPYEEISPVSGFPSAFYSVQANWAGQIAALGEILTLPIVVLISIMAQPRLMLAMGEDGLLPAFFRRLDANGNLWNGTFLAGCIMVFVATFVPFEHLNDMISFAVLSILNMTDSSLIMLWHEAPNSTSSLPVHLVLVYHAAALTTGMIFTHFWDSWWGRIIAIFAGSLMLFVPVLINTWCPRAKHFGGRRQPNPNASAEVGYFYTPLVPFWPCLGIFTNWYLIAQLEVKGIAAMLACLCVAGIYYFTYAMHTSVSNTTGWMDGHVEQIDRHVSSPPGPIEMTVIEHATSNISSSTDRKLPQIT